MWKVLYEIVDDLIFSLLSECVERKKETKGKELSTERSSVTRCLLLLLLS